MQIFSSAVENVETLQVQRYLKTRIAQVTTTNLKFLKNTFIPNSISKWRPFLDLKLNIGYDRVAGHFGPKTVRHWFDRVRLSESSGHYACLNKNNTHTVDCQGFKTILLALV